MNDRWRGRSVFVTGHTGFKGAWLSWWLTRLGAKVTGLALPPSPDRPSLFRELNLDTVIDSRFADVRDRDAVFRIMREARPQIVFHLAAQALVRPSYDAPATTFETNVMGTTTVLDAVREQPTVAAAVVVTSDKCYLNRGLSRGYREDDPLGGSDPYSASKAAQEIVCASYRSSFFSAGPLMATVRAGNVIGGGDWAPERLVPDIVAALLDGRPLVLRYPDAVRPWQHVLEPLNAYLEIGSRLLAGDARTIGAWNIGPTETEHGSVAEVVNRFSQVWGRTIEWNRETAAQPHEAPTLRLDAAKAASQLELVQRFDLDVACERTAAWYQDWASGQRARALCDADIDAFVSIGDPC